MSFMAYGLVALLACAAPALADVYKCPDGKGGSIYRNAPCSGPQVSVTNQQSMVEAALVEEH